MPSIQNATTAEVAEDTSVNLPQAQHTINTVEDQIADNNSHHGHDLDDHSSAHSSITLVNPPDGTLPLGLASSHEPPLDPLGDLYAMFQAQRADAPRVHAHRAHAQHVPAHPVSAQRVRERGGVSGSVRKLWRGAKGVVQDRSGFVKRIFRHLKEPRHGPPPQDN